MVLEETSGKEPFFGKSTGSPDSQDINIQIFRDLQKVSLWNTAHKLSILEALHYWPYG